MQVFKCAMRIMRASFAFPLIYVAGLSFMSVVLAFSAVPLDDRPSDGFERAEYAYSIIDRDNSTISHSLAEALAEGGEAIEVTDDRVAITCSSSPKAMKSVSSQQRMPKRSLQWKR